MHRAACFSTVLRVYRAYIVWVGCICYGPHDEMKLSDWTVNYIHIHIISRRPPIGEMKLSDWTVADCISRRPPIRRRQLRRFTIGVGRPPGQTNDHFFDKTSDLGAVSKVHCCRKG